MAVAAPTITIPIRTDEHGAIRVGGTRVTLDTVIACYHHGDTPERIHEGFPTLKLEDIYAVISYYLHHQAEVDAYLRQRREEAEENRKKMEAEHPEMFVLQNKMRECLAKRDV